MKILWRLLLSLEFPTIFRNHSDNYSESETIFSKQNQDKTDVNFSFFLQVSVSFDDTEKRPGQPTTLRVESDPQSLCAVGVVDKSVHILGGSNQLTIAKV